MLPSIKNIPKNLDYWTDKDAINLQTFCNMIALINSWNLNYFYFNPCVPEVIKLLFNYLDLLMSNTHKNSNTIISEFYSTSINYSYLLDNTSYDKTFRTLFKYDASFTRISEESMKDYQRLTAVEYSLQEDNNHYIQVYKNDLNLIVFTNKYNWQLLFKVKALQWRFSKDICSTYNQDIHNFYIALATYNLELCNESIKKILESPILKELQFNAIKASFELQDTQLETHYTNQIQIQQNEIEHASRRLKNAIKALQETQRNLFYLQNKVDTHDYTEIVEYLLKHPYIKYIYAYPDRPVLELYIEAPILYYDEEYAEMLDVSKRYKALIKEVFLDRKYTLWTRSKFKLNLEDFNIRPISISHDEHFIGQPHTDYYNCLGNHEDAIQDWLINKDYIGCIEQIVAMTFNLNFTDGTVINTLWETLREQSTLPTFQVANTDEYISLNEIERRRKNGQTTDNERTTGTSDSGGD